MRLQEIRSTRTRPDFEGLIREIGRVVLGKEQEIRLALTCLFADGHLLIEDMPGIGKTTLAKVLARCLGLDFARIQCTSDMLPGDILGNSVFDRHTSAFVFHPGPIFTQVLLADEINRATPKTQSALLEAMEERQVTTEGETRPLPRPFFVIATQNPFEHSGTFPLPESQYDRFLVRINLGYPDREAENRLLRQGGARNMLPAAETRLSPGEVIHIQEEAAGIHVSDALLNYVQDLLDFSRNSGRFAGGLSPRAGLAILQAARAWALLDGRDHGLPEDVQAVLPWVAAPRLPLADTLGEPDPARIARIFSEVPVP